MPTTAGTSPTLTPRSEGFCNVTPAWWNGVGSQAKIQVVYPLAAGFTEPYAIAVVELEEGPRMMSNILECPQTPEALELDMKLEVTFQKIDDALTLPQFRPAKG